MPIKKGQVVGKHQNVTVLEFGTGDISVTDGFDQDGKKETCVFFGQSNPKPVEQWNIGPDKGPYTKNSDELVDPVVMYFTHPDSIDIIIERLQNAKENLIELINK